MFGKGWDIFFPRSWQEKATPPVQQVHAKMNKLRHACVILEILFKPIYSLHLNISKSKEEKKKCHHKYSGFVMFAVHQMFVLLKNFVGSLLQAVRELPAIISLVFA